MPPSFFISKIPAPFLLSWSPPRDANVVIAVATLFWQNRKYAKARKWFERAVALDPDLGDAWATYYAFEAKNGGSGGCAASKESLEKLRSRCQEKDPNHGELWCAITKQPDIRKRRMKAGDILQLAAMRVNGFQIDIPSTL